MSYDATPSTSAMARLDTLLARQDIHDCLTGFARGMDRFDRELFLAAFHPDAIIAAGEFVGDPSSLYEWARNLHEQGQSATHHNLLNHRSELDGDSAHTETYYLYVGRNRDHTNWLAGGRHFDRFERREGECRIALRTTVVEWSATVPAAALPFADVAGIEQNGVAARNREDISYLRPLVNRRGRKTPDF